MIDFEYNGKFYQAFDKASALSAGVPLSVWNEKYLAHIKAKKLTQFNAAAEREIAALVSTYPPSEVASFPKQETEARAWLADNAAVTPLLDSLAESRGMAKAELVDKVIIKADSFAVASGEIIGKRQKLEDALAALAADNAPEQDYQALTW